MVALRQKQKLRQQKKLLHRLRKLRQKKLLQLSN
jgi:hypothetical protein